MPRRRRARLRDDDHRDDRLPPLDPKGRPYPPIGPADMPIDIVLKRLHGVRGDGPTWYACCPAHCDLTPSLSVTEDEDGTLLLYCHAGCSTDRVMQSIGLEMCYLYASPYALSVGRRAAVAQTARSPRRNPEGPDEPVIDYERFENIFDAARPTSAQIKSLAGVLSLPAGSLRAIRIGYDLARGRWVLPERDWKDRIVDITYRSAGGHKRCEPGSTRGLTIPRHMGEDGPVYIAEGASDTAALLSVGVAAIGRPAARASLVVMIWLGRLLAKFRRREIIVLGDRDPSKNGKQAGLEGARNLACFLRLRLECPVRCALPAQGYKDMREQVVAGEWKKGLVFYEDLYR